MIADFNIAFLMKNPFLDWNEEIRREGLFAQREAVISDTTDIFDGESSVGIKDDGSQGMLYIQESEKLLIMLRNVFKFENCSSLMTDDSYAHALAYYIFPTSHTRWSIVPRHYDD